MHPLVLLTCIPGIKVGDIVPKSEAPSVVSMMDCIVLVPVPVKVSVVCTVEYTVLRSIPAVDWVLCTAECTLLLSVSVSAVGTVENVLLVSSVVVVKCFDVDESLSPVGVLVLPDLATVDRLDVETETVVGP